MANGVDRTDSLTVEKLKAWKSRELDILAGRTIPNSGDRKAGHGPFQGSALIDLRQLIDVELARDQLPANTAAALTHCRAVPTASAIWAAAQAVPLGRQGADLSDLRDSLTYHAALRCSRPAMAELLAGALEAQPRYNIVCWLQGVALAVGLVRSGENENLDEELEAVDCEGARDHGADRLDSLANIIAMVKIAGDEIEKGEDDKASADTGMEAALQAMRDQLDAELAAADEAPAEQERGQVQREPARMLVIPALDGGVKPSGARAEIVKAYKSVIGKELYLVDTSRLASARTALHAMHPHMHAEIDAILSTQSALPVARFAVLLVGDAGLGKTTFARDLSEAMGIPHMTYSCAGASDGAFGGTSAQWHSARPAVPLQHVARTRTANPMLILDELDKVGSSRQNGSLSDTLLTFLERSSSRVFHDLALEHEVDLSVVSYIATANRLEDVPATLRDRFRIVRVPAPGWEHIGALSSRIIGELAAERGLDSRWLEPLAQDEIDVVRSCWKGGSIRQLQTVVTRLIDGRDQMMGRA